ncbi:alpha-keto acid decarboxylase family protein [Oecophyllibacter saccharovorans]|uniref:alpha-keto acid decarboxylase family protein n=1 Tax=Oecophyllibacter saccharovorans TaxID=2558360 RepID=UPI0011451983|nr:thiamine pyrophosphate-binding protein [Oecophyllibacter saccharovorans]QDH15387.1 alpha-keto acid decarboxylase family protein [Oecophyllibacter saccharovorans]
MSLIPIGQYLINRLYEAGLRRLYGVPGDFNLEFLEMLAADGRIAFIGTCNELNGGYAADGDGRLSGFSALLTTYGVGDLSALQAIAGAYAERVPVLSLAGAPPLHAIETRALVHHTLLNGDYDNMMQAHVPFTTAQARLLPDTAGAEIDRVITAVCQRRLPGYLQLPSDVASVMIPAPTAPLNLAPPPSDPGTLAMTADLLADKISEARAPILLVDCVVSRFQLEQEVAHFIEKTGIPFAVMLAGKGTLPESSPAYRGVYVGAGSAPALYDYVAQADCVIGLGVRFSDLATAYFTQKIQSDAWINLDADCVQTGFGQQARVLNGAGLKAVLAATLERLEGHKPFALPETGPSRPADVPAASEPSGEAGKWNGSVFWNRIQAFLRSGDVIAAEAGLSSTALNAMTFPDRTRYVIQPAWSAIGYTCPAIMGMTFARTKAVAAEGGRTAPTEDEGRSLLFIGDGALQMTAQEISTMLRHDQSLVMFVINNRGYTVERCILGVHAAYNDIANWDYTGLPGVFGPKARHRSFSVSNQVELEEALKAAENPEGLVLIEVHLGPMDVPAKMLKFGQTCNHYDYARAL